MVCQPRLDLPGIPQHTVQQGNNQLLCFLDDNDYRRYQALPREAPLATECTAAYRALPHGTLFDELLQEIRVYLQQQRALGRDDFQATTEARTQRFAGIRPAHRPPKSATDK